MPACPSGVPPVEEDQQGSPREDSGRLLLFREDFGADTWCRFSYACSEDAINKGFDRIAELLKDVG